MNIIAWNIALNEPLLFEDEEIAIDELTGIGTDGQNYVGKYARFNGNTIKQYHLPVIVAPSDPVKLVGMGAFGELLPTAVRTEIRGYALDANIGAAKRKAAGQIVNRIHSNKQIDANGDELATLLGLLVTHTVFTQAESDAVLEALQA